MIEENMNNLIDRFRKSGGTIDNYYLRKDRPSRQVLVNLNGWYSGSNVREAIKKALLSQSNKKTSRVGSAGNTGFK